MCFPQGQVIAIFGPSGSGKTSVANLLANELNLPTRICGDVVRNAAKGKQVSVKELSDEDHHQIDLETMRWVIDSKCCIVEGRFLDAVLYDAIKPVQVNLVKIDANSKVRAERLSERSRRNITVDTVQAIDEEDLNFRKRVYAGSLFLSPKLILDTSNLSQHDCLSRVLDHLKASTE